jgi:hypothetical protein
LKKSDIIDKIMLSPEHKPSLDPGKYLLIIGERSITETFMTQQLSGAEYQSLLKKLDADMGPKK